jgi:hypothetical protein
MRSMQLLRHPEYLASVTRTQFPFAAEETITFYTDSTLRTVARGGGKVLMGHGTDDRALLINLPPALLYLIDTFQFPEVPSSDPSPDLTLMPPDLLYLVDEMVFPPNPDTDPSPDTTLMAPRIPSIAETFIMPDYPHDTVTMTIT